jgi:hypothetical protein
VFALTYVGLLRGLKHKSRYFSQDGIAEAGTTTSTPPSLRSRGYPVSRVDAMVRG